MGTDLIDLRDEFSAACCSLDGDRLQTVFAAGVPKAALDPLLFGMATIQIHGTTYEPVDVGERAVIVPCGTWDWPEWQLVDLVGFRLEDPTRWWRRLGAADVLGDAHGFTVEPKTLHPTPLDWLRSGGKGLVVLDWSCDPMHLLLSAGRLRASETLKSKLLAVAKARAKREIQELVI